MADRPDVSPLSKEAAEDVRTVVKGGAVQVVGQFSQRGLSFLFQLVAANLLGQAAYGLYRQVSQVLTIAGQLGLAGFNYASMRWIARARAAGQAGGVKGAARVGASGAIVASVIVVVALFVLADKLGTSFGDSPEGEDDFARLFRIGAPYVPLFALLQVFRYCTQGYKTMVPSVTAGNIVQPVIRFVLGVALLLAGLEVAGAITSLTVSMGISAVVAFWFFRRMLSEEERVAPTVTQVGPMVRFALPQAGASLLGIQTLGLGIILIGLLENNAAAGAFGIALSLQGPANVFLGGIVNIWAPIVSDLHEKGEIARLDSLYKTINRWIATFSFPVAAAIIVEADLFTRLFGEGRNPDPTAAVAILAIGNIFYTGTGPTGYVISMTGRPFVNFINSAVAVALYIGFGLLLVPEHGLVGMAWVDAGVTAVVNLARVVQAKWLVGVQPFGRSFYKPVVATLAGVAVLVPWSLFADEKVLLEVVGIAVGGLVYVALLKVFGLDPEEEHVWRRIRKRAFKRGR